MSKFTGCISTLCTTFKGLSKAVDLPSEITNMLWHIISAGNAGYANHKPSERRTVSGDSPHGEFAVTFSYSENIPILRNFL